MLDRVNTIVANGEHATPSEFVRDAVRREFERREKVQLQQESLRELAILLEEGLDSGEPISYSRADALKERIIAKAKQRKTNES